MNRHAKPLALGLAALLSEPCFADFSTGTGFAVTTSKLITNYHVVKGCSDVAVVTGRGNRKARVVAYDEEADLALLHSLGVSSAVAPLRQAEPRLGEWAGVFGFPLTGTLTATGNFTDGVVSALRGIDEDASKFQFTAPIQQGNSGGPLLDASGNVIGVVVSKLNVLNQAKSTGDIAQNVNFAVSPSILKSFISDQKVPFTSGTSKKLLSGEQVAATAKDFTFLLVCEPAEDGSIPRAPAPIVKKGAADKSNPNPPSQATPAPRVDLPPNFRPSPELKTEEDSKLEVVALHVFDKREPVSYVENLTYTDPSLGLQSGPALKINFGTCLFGNKEWPGSNHYEGNVWVNCNYLRGVRPTASTLVVTAGSQERRTKLDLYGPLPSFYIKLNGEPEIRRELDADRPVKIEIVNDYFHLLPEQGEFFIRPVLVQRKSQIPIDIPNAEKNTPSDREMSNYQIARDKAIERCSVYPEVVRRNSVIYADNRTTYNAFVSRAVYSCYIEPEPTFARLRARLKAEGKFKDLASVEVRQDESGNVKFVLIRTSSGLAAYDEAMKKAILDASPLPLPANRQLFHGSLLFNFDLSTFGGR